MVIGMLLCEFAEDEESLARQPVDGDLVLLAAEVGSQSGGPSGQQLIRLAGFCSKVLHKRHGDRVSHVVVAFSETDISGVQDPVHGARFACRLGSHGHAQEVTQQKVQ